MNSLWLLNQLQGMHFTSPYHGDAHTFLLKKLQELPDEPAEESVPDTVREFQKDPKQEVAELRALLTDIYNNVYYWCADLHVANELFERTKKAVENT